MDMNAMNKISYGLYVIFAREGEKDNGCICNTAAQVTSTPNRVSVTLNKSGYTHDMILRTGEFNVSVLSEDADFSVFTHYGFKSGRDTDKIVGPMPRSENGLCYLEMSANAYLSCRVVSTVDLGTHTMFIADVTGGEVLSDTPSATYAYYHSHIKPKPQEKKTEETVWVCDICGYEYVGEEVPEDFVCPICKHGKADFKRKG